MLFFAAAVAVAVDLVLFLFAIFVRSSFNMKRKERKGKEINVKSTLRTVIEVRTMNPSNVCQSHANWQPHKCGQKMCFSFFLLWHFVERKYLYIYWWRIWVFEHLQWNKKISHQWWWECIHISCSVLLIKCTIGNWPSNKRLFSLLGQSLFSCAF